MMRTLDTIIIHCSATSPSMNIGRKEIDRWHSDRGFWCPQANCHIGYHFVIRRNGTVEVGRPIQYQGAHAKGYNKNSVGICLVGGVGEDKKTPECNFTPEQWRALDSLVTNLQEQFPDIKTIIGHNQVAQKACPCFDVQDWLKVRHRAAVEGRYPL